MEQRKICTSNDRIRELIKEYGISQTEFCERTKINKSALSNYLKGDRVPRQDQLTKIAEAFNVSPTWLMGYDVPQSNNIETLAVTGEMGLLIDAFKRLNPDNRAALLSYAKFLNQKEG